MPVSLREAGAKELEMARGKKHTLEQIVSLLPQIDVAVANGRPPVGFRDNGIIEQTYYRWRKECGGLLVSELSFEKLC